jgi:hypothetical protein
VAGGCVGDAALKNPPGGPSRSGPGARAARRGFSDGRWPAALSVAGRSDRSKRATCDDKAWARSLQRWSVTTRQRGRDERTTTWDVSGANLKHRARDAGELADLRFRHFDKPRCREASRCVGPARTRRSARPRSFRGRRKADWNTACPGPQRIRAMSRACCHARECGHPVNADSAAKPPIARRLLGLRFRGDDSRSGSEGRCGHDSN